jgi:large subunit ribosomal protein L22
MEVRAVAKNLRVSASKARLLANIVRGEKVDDALTLLKFTPTPTANLVAKVIKSAAANAEKGFQMSPANLKIIRILVDQAPMMKRYRPAARGRASPILKRSSHITVIVAEQES